MERYQKTIAVAAMMLMFGAWFVRNTRHDLPLIFQKDLHAHDESSNSVVAANITRKFFPPMVRTNPLNDQQGNWMEGPFWQHIPPLFAYVPYVFFKLDGQVTIEIKRLSYAFVTLLTGLLFIFAVYKYRESLLAALAGTIAAIFWVNTPFTHELITGYTFGASDIVLAFTVVCSFAAMIWYLRREGEERREYPTWKLMVIGMIVALPIMAKNLLGAIPAATYFILLLRDHRAINKKVLAAMAGLVGLLALYLLPLYFSSPQTFKKEILVSFLHLQNLEGWGRPWHWYVTNYLPQRYLFGWTWVYYAGLVFAIIYNVRAKVRITSRVALVWFVWNLVAISLVTSKVPNFIYQTYLLSLYAIVYTIVVTISNAVRNRSQKRFLPSVEMVVGLLVLCLLSTGYESIGFAQAFNAERTSVYNYQTEHEKFYQTAEELRSLGLNQKDLVIVRASDNDCWFRYYTLFLTGAESKALLEMSFGYDAYAVKAKYDYMYFVANRTDRLASPDATVIELANYTAYQFDLKKMNPGPINDTIANFLADHNDDIPADIARIKKDKTSCQWLVPDAILNAP